METAPMGPWLWGTQLHELPGQVHLHKETTPLPSLWEGELLEGGLVLPTGNGDSDLGIIEIEKGKNIDRSFLSAMYFI